MNRGSPPTRSKLFLLLGSAVVALALCEGALRVLRDAEWVLRWDGDEDWWEHIWLEYRRKSQAHSPLSHSNPLMVHSATLGWRPVASYREGHFTLNSKGVRGSREHPYHKSLGERRIVVMGNSFTFAPPRPEIPDEEIYTALLERSLLGVSVINLGVAGYGTDQQLLYLREEGFKYHPDLIIAAVFIDNLGRSTLAFRDYAKPRFRVIAGKLDLTGVPVPPPEVLEQVVRPHVPRSYLWTVAKKAINSMAAAWAPLGVLEVDRLNEAILNTMREESRQHGAKLLVVVIPHDALTTEWDRSERFIDDWGRRAGVPVLLLRHAFHGLPDDLRAKLYEGHWTSFGHKAAAGAILSKVAEGRLLEGH